jgi:hypothetical protein
LKRLQFCFKPHNTFRSKEISFRWWIWWKWIFCWRESFLLIWRIDTQQKESKRKLFVINMKFKWKKFAPSPKPSLLLCVSCEHASNTRKRKTLVEYTNRKKKSSSFFPWFFYSREFQDKEKMKRFKRDEIVQELMKN